LTTLQMRAGSRNASVIRPRKRRRRKRRRLVVEVLLAVGDERSMEVMVRRYVRRRHRVSAVMMKDWSAGFGVMNVFWHD